MIRRSNVYAKNAEKAIAKLKNQYFDFIVYIENIRENGGIMVDFVKYKDFIIEYNLIDYTTGEVI